MDSAEQLRNRIEGMYERFNARDIDSVLEQVTDTVVWANGMDGGHVHGRDAVRAYWSRRFAIVRSTVEPLEIDIEHRAAEGMRE